MIVALSMLQATFFQCTQLSNHLSTEFRINYGENFNFIGIKKKKN